MPHFHQRRLTALVLAWLLLPLPALAQPAPEPTLETIMAHPDWIGNPPEDPYWADDGRAVYYLHKRTGEEQKDLVRVDLESGEAAVVAIGDEGKADAPGGDLSLDRRWKTYARQGDVFLKDLRTGTIRQITRTEAEESDPRFLAGGIGDNRIAFQRDDQVFVYDLVAGTLFQAAELKLEKDPAEDEDSGYLDEQQERLFDVIREGRKKQEQARERDRSSRELDPTRAPLPWYLGEEVEIVGSDISPDGDWMIVVTQGKDLPKKPSTMARFVTEDGYLKADEVRSKVGTEPLVDHKILLLDLKSREQHEVDLSKLPGIMDDPLKELREKAEKKKDQKDGKDGKDEKKKEEKEEKKPRPVEVQGLFWTDDGRYAALILRAPDNKDRWIVTVQREHPEPVTRHRLTDPAWINWDFNEVGWLPDNDTLWYTSEESGWSNLYAVSMQDGKTRRLVEGKLEVSNVKPSLDGKTFFYRANAEKPIVYDIWRVPASGGKPEQLTRTGGDTWFWLSPDESQLLLLHSTSTRHGELYVQPAQPAPSAETARQLTRTHSAEYLAIDWTVPEIVPIPSSHTKTPIWSRVFTPKDFDPSRPSRQYPAVVFSHGAGYLQNAHAGWSNYFRETLFHTFLNRHGYVVLDMDYRASAGYGRDWRTAIYRQMGYPEVEDLEDGVAWLVRNRNVDPKRIGHYGGSYGGFLTFMAMFRKPDLFAAGAALRPVADWAHYNHEYTSNILNTPEVDPEAFEKSSPIEYAAGLSKPLLMCSGMVDNNVFFQDTVRMAQRLIELKKENFETAIYPVESHSFTEPTSWLDEYRRIFKLFENHVK